MKFNPKLSDTLKKQSNKTIKAAVVAVCFKEVAEEKFLETLRNARHPASAMVHKKRQTLWEEYGVLAKVKIGDWVNFSSLGASWSSTTRKFLKPATNVQLL